jgi:predicted PurR-regulated permease PerM
VAFTAAALLLFFQGGSALASALVFGVGAAVMLVGDYFVWPTLVGGAARLPFLLALIGIFGGLQTFGLLGLFIGPVIMAAVVTIWREISCNAKCTAAFSSRTAIGCSSFSFIDGSLRSSRR